MAQIIQFPVKTQAVSNGYDNLSRLIAVAATKEVLNFYIESIEQLEKTGNGKTGSDRKRNYRGSWSIPLYGRNGRPETSLPDGSIQRILRKALVH